MATAAPTFASTTDKPPLPWRWIPLSLRIFVAILVLLGVASAWIGVRGYQQLAAIREIEWLGGFTELQPVGPKWRREPVGDERMRMFDEVVEVNLFQTQETDTALHQISRLPRLRRLDITGSQATDVGLAQVTDAGVAKLQRALPGLTVHR